MGHPPCCFLSFVLFILLRVAFFSCVHFVLLHVKVPYTYSGYPDFLTEFGKLLSNYFQIGHSYTNHSLSGQIAVFFKFCFFVNGSNPATCLKTAC